MAVLKVLPEQWIIDYFKGTIDFYEWNGIPVARKWPYHPPRERSEAELHNLQLFKLACELVHQLPPYVQSHYVRVSKYYRCSWRDLFIRIWMKGHRG